MTTLAETQRTNSFREGEFVEVRYTRTDWRKATGPLIAFLLLGLICILIFPAATGYRKSWALGTAAFGAIACFIVLNQVVSLSRPLVIDEEGIRLFRLGRFRTFPWSDVVEIRVETPGRGRETVLLLLRRGGPLIINTWMRKGGAGALIRDIRAATMQRESPPRIRNPKDD